MANQIAILFFACLFIGISAQSVTAQTNTATGTEALQSTPAALRILQQGTGLYRKIQWVFIIPHMVRKLCRYIRGVSGNTAVGHSALEIATEGDYNTAIGYGAMKSNRGGFNAAVGVGALVANGGNSTALGYGAMEEVVLIP